MAVITQKPLIRVEWVFSRDKRLGIVAELEREAAGRFAAELRELVNALDDAVWDADGEYRRF